MGVEIIGQQTSLDDVVSLFLDLSPCVCVCVRAHARFVMWREGGWGGDPAALNVPPSAYCISLSSEGVRAGPPTSHHSQTSKKSLLVTRLRKAGLHVHVYVELMCLFLTLKKNVWSLPAPGVISDGLLLSYRCSGPDFRTTRNIGQQTTVSFFCSVLFFQIGFRNNFERNPQMSQNSEHSHQPCRTKIPVFSICRL